jgi:serine protease
MRGGTRLWRYIFKALNNALLLLFLFINFFSFGQTLPEKHHNYFRMPEKVGPEDYLPAKVIVKLKPEFEGILKNGRSINPELQKALEAAKVREASQRFAGISQNKKRTNGNEADVGLSRVYELSLDKVVSMEKAINRLYQSGMFEYVEPFYVPSTCFTPNDPQRAEQYSLGIIKAFGAWGFIKGDTNVVVGIVDTGVDFTHPDLKGNIKYNYNDPINGIDDDMDGFVDNFYGWDFGENDNDPQFNSHPHGVHVSGIAAASTNNGVGIAGIGFNCKFLPIKIANAEGSLVRAYEGIIYAANQGCDIINCSWGSVGGGQLGQDIIDYATSLGSLVVAAAGNNSSEEKFFPAAYKNCLSVAATNSADIRWGASNYGYFVDVCAPGDQIYSTLPNNTYGASSGTSMAAPNVAGAAALVKSRFPNYSPLQVAEQLKVTADNIYPNHNANMEGKLGFGRINLQRAVTETNLPSVALIDYSAKGRVDDYFIAGDTMRLSTFFTNYLAPASNISVTLSAIDPFVKILNNKFQIGALATMASADNSAKPFYAEVLKSAPINSLARFKVNVSDGGAYNVDYYFGIPVNVDYLNIKVNDIGTTITSKGRIGYNSEGQAEGLGFTYKNHPSLLYESGLIIGNSPVTVSSTVRGNRGETDEDFSSILRVDRSSSKISSLDLEGKFNDKASESPLQVTVNHNTYAWDKDGSRNYIIKLYDIINKGNAELNGLHVGLFADWDIMDAEKNKIGYDENLRMGFAYSTEPGGLYAGIKLLSKSAKVIHYGIDNIYGGGGGVDLSDGFSKDKKFRVITENRDWAGVMGDGNDVIDVVSTGPFNLMPDDTAFVAFALLAGENLESLQKGAEDAQKKYDNEIPHFRNHKPIDESKIWLGNAFPNPAKNTAVLEFYLPEPMQVNFSLFNSLGQMVETFYEDTAPEGLTKIHVSARNYSGGMYYFRLIAGGTAKTGKITFLSH